MPGFELREQPVRLGPPHCCACTADSGGICAHVTDEALCARHQHGGASARPRHRPELASTAEQRLVARLYVALASAWDMGRLDEPARGRFFRDGVPWDEYEALCAALRAAGRGEECGWLAKWIRKADGDAPG